MKIVSSALLMIGCGVVAWFAVMCVGTVVDISQRAFRWMRGNKDAWKTDQECLMAKTSEVLEFMKKHNIPLTRENYLEVAYMGTPPVELDAEEEAALPPELRNS